MCLNIKIGRDLLFNNQITYDFFLKNILLYVINLFIPSYSIQHIEGHYKIIILYIVKYLTLKTTTKYEEY